MEQVRDVFEREYEATMKADLESGVGSSFPSGLRFVREPSLSHAVAAAAQASQVCYESSVRGLLYHLPILLHHVSLCLRPFRERLQSGSSQVRLSGDPATGVVTVELEHPFAVATIKPEQWLGMVRETVGTVLPTGATPRSSSPFVKAAKLAIQVVKLREYEVDMDSTANTSGCCMDITARKTRYYVKVRVTERTATAGKGTGRKLLIMELPEQVSTNENHKITPSNQNHKITHHKPKSQNHTHTLRAHTN